MNVCMRRKLIVVSTSLGVVDRGVGAKAQWMQHCLEAQLAKGYTVHHIDLATVPTPIRDEYINKVKRQGTEPKHYLPVLVVQEGLTERCFSLSDIQAMSDRGGTIWPPS